MILGAIVSIKVVGGYGRVIEDEGLYILAHDLKNKVMVARLRMEAGF